MELKEGELYIAYKYKNPLENLRFTLLKEDDLFLEVKVEDGFDNLELWKTYVVALPHSFGAQRYLEIAPYRADRESKTARFVILGFLPERRKFYRFAVEDLDIPVESDHFEGIVENVSLGGMKIKVSRWKNRNLKEGDEVYVKTRVEDKEYHFIVKPVKVAEHFIAAKFEKPAKVTSEFFHHCLKLLNRRNAEEQQGFKRFSVKELNVIADTPLGVGILYDVAFDRFRIKLRKTYGVDAENLGRVFPVSFFLPATGEEFIVDAELVSRSKDGFLTLKVAKWNDDALKFISRIFELIVKSRGED